MVSLTVSSRPVIASAIASFAVMTLLLRPGWVRGVEAAREDRAHRSVKDVGEFLGG